MNFKVLSIGGVLQEIIYNTDAADVIWQPMRRQSKKMIAVDYGAKISSNQVWRSYGGGALNSLATFNSLGLKCAPVSIIGDDLAGHEILHYLAKRKVCTKFIEVDKTKETAFSFILNLPEDNEHVVFVSQGVLNKFRFKKVLLKHHRADWLYITSLRGNGAEFNLREIFHYAKDQAVKIFWNPGQQQINNFNKYLKYLNRVAFLSLNLQEAKILTGLLKLSDKSVSTLAKFLIESGCQAVLITKGVAGVELYTAQKVYKQPGKKVKVINTTGAGDAFNAAFLSGYIIYQGDYQVALQLGVRNAVAVIQTIGAHQGVLTKKDL